jgi:aminoglycoside phosphotransferase family enzyme
MSVPTWAQSEILEFLKSPSSHRHTTHTPGVVETNQSWVVLMGNYAYKLYKAGSRPRGNTTPGQRLENAQLELAANTKMAGRLYVGIRAIVPGKKGLTFAKVGTPGAVDYVLRMRRFDQADLFYTRLFDGRLTADHLTALADRLAAFHASQPPSSAPQLRGCGPTLHRYMTTALSGYVGFLANTSDGAVFAALAEGWAAAMGRERFRLDNRNPWAHRHVHGDMDFGNIALLKSLPTPFDAQVLDPLQAQEDVLLDVGFVLAPLFLAHRPDLARAFADRYFALTGDVEGRQLAYLWVALAALIRAGSWLRRAHRMPDSADKALLLARGRTFLQVARAAIARELPDLS